MFIGTLAFGQDPFMFQIGEEEGLPSMTTYKILQDKKGFIWIGTENGLCRYDGKEVKVYENPELIDNEILDLQEDSFGKIWIKNLAGQLAYVRNDSIQIVDLQQKILTYEFVINGNDLWVLTNLEKQNEKIKSRELFYYEINPTGLENYYLKTEINFALRSNIEKYGEKILVRGIGLKHMKLFQCEKKGNAIEKKSIFDLDHSNYSINVPNRISVINENQILLSMPKSTFLIKKNGKWIVEKDRFDVENIKNIFKKEEETWMITSNGIIPYHKIKSFPIPLDLISVSKSELVINFALFDNENNLWLATNGKGVKMIPSLQNLWYTNMNSGISSDKVYNIFSDENGIFIGMDQSKVNILRNDEIKIIDVDVSDRINDFYKDHLGRYWISTNKRISVYDENMNLLKKFVGGYKCLRQDAQQNYLMGLSSTCGKIEKKSLNPSNLEKIKLIDSHKINFEDGKRIPLERKIIKRTYAVHTSHSNKTWIGTSEGIYFINNQQDGVPFLENGVHRPYSISKMVESRDSIIWVSTLSDGILGIKNDSVIYRFNKDSGLASNNCKTLYYDDYNNLWIGTKKGLHKLNLNNFEIDLINKYDGLPTNEIYTVYAADSTVWIGTMKGLISIPFDKIKKNKIPPPIHLTSIKIWEKDTILLDEYNLKHDQDNLNIEFVGLTYRNRGNTNYQYRMIGIDTNWVNTTTRFARFPQLNSGEYEFQVKAINEDGVESIQPASIQFKIAQPWWETWWFYLFVALGLIGGTAFVFYNRFRRIQKEEKRKQEFNEHINELRSMALQAQMNPHFVFNAMNAIQKFLTTNEQEEAMIYLARFAQLIRTIFEQSKQKEITLEEEIEFLNLYLELEKLRFKDKVDVQFVIDESIKDVDYDIKIPPLLIQPIVENAFKHGLMHKEVGGVLKVHFSKNKNVLYCVIKDNGVGRKNAEIMGEGKIKNQNPSGILTTKERLRIFNSSLESSDNQDDLIIEDLFDERGMSTGTKVQINIKYT